MPSILPTRFARNLLLACGFTLLSFPAVAATPPPPVTAPIQFNTPEADAIVSKMQIFPPDNPWHEDVSKRPLIPNSEAMMARIAGDLRADRRNLRAFPEMNYVLVPDNQPLVPIKFVNYPDDSDPGPYPIPANLPIEGWPRSTGAYTLEQTQRDMQHPSGDRHAIIVMPGAGLLWEIYTARLVSGAWEASNGAKFDLKSNKLRPDGWTSSDAAGLPIFPSLVRYDECQRGVVDHALRLCVDKTRPAYIHPATHWATRLPASEVDEPAMGQRLRLKAGFHIPADWTKEERAICAALQKYGALVADNSGGFFSISVCPDERFPEECFDHLLTVKVADFEVIETTSPGHPSK